MALRNPFKLPGVPKDQYLDENLGDGSMSRSLGSEPSDSDVSASHLMKPEKLALPKPTKVPRFHKLAKLIKPKI